jgi:hypothetical protein
MHHVRISLHIHQPFNLHGPVLANAPQIVPAQIDQHNVFGPLLWIGQQFRFKLAVFDFVSPSPARSGERLVERIASLDLHQHFGGTSGY